MKRELQVGDRVAVYGISGQKSWHHRICGTVRVVQDDPPRIHFDSDETLPGDGYVERYVATPQQCRRLIRRERRRVWIWKEYFRGVACEAREAFRETPPEPGDTGFVEFLEARPRKEREK